MLLSFVILLSAVVLPICSRPDFVDLIPNGNNPLLQSFQGVGHEQIKGGGSLNPFGYDFKKENYTWTFALCQMDSDLDGFTNGEELGDPYCTWKQGMIPNRTSHLSSPGHYELRPNYSSDFADLTFLSNAILSHICLVYLSLFVFIPLAITISIFKIYIHSWLFYHMSIHMIALMLSFAGFCVIVHKPIQSTHGILGSVLYILLLIQWGSGSFRPKKSSTRWRCWHFLHTRISIYILVVLILSTSVLGILLLPVHYQVPMMILFICMIFIKTIFVLCLVGIYLC